MKRNDIWIALALALVVTTTAVTAYAASCFEPGSAAERWGLELVAVTVDGEQTDDLSSYGPLLMELESNYWGGELRVYTSTRDDVVAEYIQVAPAQGSLREDE